MALCGSQNCGCALASSSSITVTGSGNPGDPWVLSGSAIPLPVVNTYTASTTWIKPAGLKYVEVEVQGAGGGSGGCATTAVDQAAVGMSGAGGGYARKVIAATTLGASETVTVGAGGTAGTAGANNGGTGGTSSFGTHCSANGGAGGTGSAASAGSLLIIGTPVSGGTATGGDVNISGSKSERAIINSTGTRIFHGAPGASTLCPGKRVILAATTSTAGVAGDVYGGGAAGAANIASDGTARAGAVGGAGVVIVKEYY